MVETEDKKIIIDILEEKKQNLKDSLELAEFDEDIPILEGEILKIKGLLNRLSDN